MEPRTTTRRILANTLLMPMLLLPTLPTGAVADAAPVADGSTWALTPHGTWILPPPGSPLLLVQEDRDNVHVLESAPMTTSTHGLAASERGDAGDPSARAVEPGGHDGAFASDGALEIASSSSCTQYMAGWYVTDSSSLHGGHVGIVPQHMPPNSQYYCPGMAMGYTDGVSFGVDSWIQAGLAISPGESGAKWFCQANDNGARTTRYGNANAYGNGASVYTWFARDSAGIWRTYRYDTGPYAVELGCTIARGASGNLQLYGEIQGATSTLAPMGPWQMFDIRYLPSNTNQWYVPSQLQANYPLNTPCPPYGAGSVVSGIITAGSGQTCATGTSPYPS